MTGRKRQPRISLIHIAENDSSILNMMPKEDLHRAVEEKAEKEVVVSEENQLLKSNNWSLMHLI